VSSFPSHDRHHVALAIGAGLAVPPAADAASKARTFTNCTEMHKTYKGGVAKKGAVDKNSAGRPVKQHKYLPKVSDALYRANVKSDRDKDGVACEVAG
jgi:hypothetical protein